MALLKRVFFCTFLFFMAVDGRKDGTMYVMDKDMESYGGSLLNVLNLEEGEPRNVSELDFPEIAKDFALDPGEGTYIYARKNGIYKKYDDRPDGEQILSVYSLPEACGELIDRPSVNVKSPSNPMDSEEPLRCRWRIAAPEGKVVQLNITQWVVPEQTTPCDVYELEITDDEGVLLSSCDPELTSTLVTSRGQEMIIDFVYRNFTSGMGLEASYVFADEPVSGNFLFVVNHVDRYLTLLSDDGESESFDLSSNFSSLPTVDFDPEEMQIYVSDGSNSIAKMNLDGSNFQEFHSDGASVLRIDHVNRRIFYTNIACTCVKYINMTGAGDTTIVDTNIREPRGLALVNDLEYVFFTDWRKSKVWRVSYSGSDRTQILKKSDGLMWPNGLYHYEEESRIYLADGALGKIFRFDYDGNALQELVDSSYFPSLSTINPNAIYVDEDTFYIADFVKGLLQLERNSTENGTSSDLVELNMAYDLVYYSFGDNATESMVRERRSIADDFEWRESASSVRRTDSRNDILGVFVSPTTSDIFVQYLDKEREEWFLASIQDMNGTYPRRDYDSSVIWGSNEKIRIVGNSDRIFIEGRDGVFSFNYTSSNPSFTLRYEVRSNLPLAVNDDYLCFIPEEDRSIIQCYDLNDDGDNLLETAPVPVNFTAVSFNGDTLYGSYSENETHHLCFGDSIEVFNCSNSITPENSDIWNGIGTPIRILFEDDQCQSTFKSVVTMFPACFTFKPERKTIIDRWTSDGDPDAFFRAVSTGPKAELPSFMEEKGRIIIGGSKRNRRQITGVYSFNFTNGDNIVVPVQFGGSTSFSKPSITVYPGDTVKLTIRKKSGRRVRWYRNESPIGDWRNQKTVVIDNIISSDAGVYESYLQQRRSTRLQGFVRIIVADCPKGFTSPPNCTDPAPPCMNGGVLDTKTDECICAPGFIGCACENFLSRGQYGPNGQLECPGMNCEGRLICQPDPYGCSCAAGFTGTFCTDPCPSGRFGADCVNTCRCLDPRECDSFTGECGSSSCLMGWSGPNCQIQQTW